MNAKQYTFSEMSRKMVVNVADGRELGHVCDMVFNNCGAVLALVVPGKKSLFKSIASSENIYIAWNRIIKIGSDVILTDIVSTMATPENAPAQEPCQQPVFRQSTDPPQYTPPVYTTPQEGAQPPSGDGSAQTYYH